MKEKVRKQIDENRKRRSNGKLRLKSYTDKDAGTSRAEWASGYSARIRCSLKKHYVTPEAMEQSLSDLIRILENQLIKLRKVQ